MELIEALNGRQGDLDTWLEAHSEAEVREAIKALISPEETLRDKFAAQAMQSFLLWPDAPRTPGGEIARSAYLMAEKMLEERAK